MRYAILGTTQAVSDDGTPLALAGGRLRALLTALALRPGRVVGADALIDEVWAGEPPAGATGALQALVGRLRKVLGYEAVGSAEGGYRLVAAPDDVDLYRFERLAGEGAQALADGDPVKATGLLGDALALWRGPALADLPHRDTAAVRSEALRLDAHRRRLTAELALGRAAHILPDLAELAAAHPLDEPLHALHLRALRAAGRTADALAAYEALRRALADQLGADPSPELRALHAELLDPVPPGPAGHGHGYPESPAGYGDAGGLPGAGTAPGWQAGGHPAGPAEQRGGSAGAGAGAGAGYGYGRPEGAYPAAPDGSGPADAPGNGSHGAGGGGASRGGAGAGGGGSGREAAAGAVRAGGGPDGSRGPDGHRGGDRGARLPGNARARLTSFVGREADLAAVRGDLARARLVTITGPGGTGKTRLSQEAGDQVAAWWPDGVWYAELAPVSDPRTLPEAVISSLGLRETLLHSGAGAQAAIAAETKAKDPARQLADYCANRNLLLVLDNCEHVIDAAAALAEHLLATCPGVSVLATSREPLGVPGELVRPLDPLPEPTALRLLADRGAAARPGFRVDDDPVACAELCRRLDGLPLAVELAAARLRSLSPRQLADRLDDRFRLLTGGSRTLLPRQQTLRAVVDWSWDLLDPAERALLRRLAVFRGGWTLEAVEAICADPPAAELRVPAARTPPDAVPRPHRTGEHAAPGDSGPPQAGASAGHDPGPGPDHGPGLGHVAGGDGDAPQGGAGAGHDPGPGPGPGQVPGAGGGAPQAGAGHDAGPGSGRGPGLGHVAGGDGDALQAGASRDAGVPGRSPRHVPGAGGHRVAEPAAGTPVWIGSADAAALLSSLVDKSLVLADLTQDGARYRMLETIGEYAAERLTQSGESTAVERRHIAYFREFARTADPRLRGAGQLVWFERLEREHENLRAALRRAVRAGDEQEALLLVLGCSWFWEVRNYQSERRRWPSAVAAMGPDPFEQPPVLEPAERGPLDDPLPLAGERLREARRWVRIVELSAQEGETQWWTDPRLVRVGGALIDAYPPHLPQSARLPGILRPLGALFSGRFDRLHELMDETVQSCRTHGRTWELAFSLQLRAKLNNDVSERLQDCLRDIEESRSLFERLGDEWGSAEALSAEAEAAGNGGDWQRAAACCREGIALARRIGSHQHVPVLMVRLGNALVNDGREEEGERLLREGIRDATCLSASGEGAAFFGKVLLAGVLSRRGAGSEALELIEDTVREHESSIRDSGVRGFVFGVLTAMRGFLIGRSGDPDRGLAMITEGMAELSGHPLSGILNPRLGILITPGAVELLTVLAEQDARPPAGSDLPGSDLPQPAGQDGDTGTGPRRLRRARRAATLVGAHDRLRPSAIPPAEADDIERIKTRLRRLLGDTEYQAAYATGAGLTTEEAVALMRDVD